MKEKVIVENKGDHQLFEDLDYIKKHLRYPNKRGGRTSLLVFILIFLAVVVFSFFDFFTSNQDLKDYRILILAGVGTVLLLFSIHRFYKVLKFSVLETNHPKEWNREKVLSFLEHKHLVVFKHDQSEDIIQIISRPLSSGNDQRQVVVFIIDDDKILLNNHLINGDTIKLSYHSVPEKQFISELTPWIKGAIKQPY